MPSATFYTYSNTLGVGVRLYTDPARTIIAPDGTYSDGSTCFTINTGDGIISSFSTCPDPTPTPTATVTPTTTPPATPAATPTVTPTTTPPAATNYTFYLARRYECESIPGDCYDTGQDECIASTNIVTLNRYYRNVHPDGGYEIYYPYENVGPGVCYIVTLGEQQTICANHCGNTN